MRKSLTISVLLALAGLINVYAQEPSIIEFLIESENKYGSDADLVNGEKYLYPYAQALGDPFLFPDARRAAINIHEKEFKEQLLRYDVYNQQLILDYENLYGVNASLVLRTEWVEAFAFDGQQFKKLEGPDGKTGFFQLVSGGKIFCVYRWSKKYLLNLTSGVQSYYFTDPVKAAFLVIEGQFQPYKTNGSFIKLFDSELRKPVKQFMRQSKINVKKASDGQMRHLLEYCNALAHENE